MVEGVSAGYEKRLELVGVGYRAQQKGSDLEIQVGYSHPIDVEAPDGITLQAPTQTEIIVSGIDKQLVGQVAANIRRLRPPEPYKGKGIKYAGERHPSQGRQGRGALGPSTHPPAVREPTPLPQYLAPQGSTYEEERHGRCHAQAPGRDRRRRRIRKKISGTADQAAPVDLPQQRPHLRAADRRPRRPHAGRRQLPRGRRDQGRRRQDRRRRPGRRPHRPARDRGRASPSASSTVAATATRGASRPSPTPPATPA